jgi:hypothetical protein
MENYTDAGEEEITGLQLGDEKAKLFLEHDARLCDYK